MTSLQELCMCFYYFYISPSQMLVKSRIRHNVLAYWENGISNGYCFSYKLKI